MEEMKKLSEAWHFLRSTLDQLDDGRTGAKAAIHIQWAIDLIDEELTALNAPLSTTH